MNEGVPEYIRARPRPPAPPDWPRLLRALARWSLVGGVLYLLGRLLWRTGGTLTPFIIGLVMAYLLLPIVKRLDRLMPRWASILTVYLIGLVLTQLVFLYIVPRVAEQVSSVARAIPGWYDSGYGLVLDLIGQFQKNTSEDIRALVDEQIQRISQTLRANASTYAQSVAQFLLNSVLGIFETLAFLLGFLVIPFFLFYILLDTNKLPPALDRVLHPQIRDDFWNLWSILDGVFGRYIRGQLLLGLIVGLMSFIGLTVLNLAFGLSVPYTALLAIIAGVGELIPVVGPILSAIPAVIAAFGAGDRWVTAVVAVIILYVVIQQVENQVLVPRIVGNNLRLHPAVLMALLVAAASVGGLGLVILSAPLAAICRDAFVYLHRRLREPPQTPAQAISGLVIGDDVQPAPKPRTRAARRNRQAAQKAEEQSGS